jgi:hypothetical protein
MKGSLKQNMHSPFQDTIIWDALIRKKARRKSCKSLNNPSPSTDIDSECEMPKRISWENIYRILVYFRTKNIYSIVTADNRA